MKKFTVLGDELLEDALLILVDVVYLKIDDFGFKIDDWERQRINPKL